MDKIEKMLDFLKSKIDISPETGIILGSGLGSLGEKIENPTYIDYKDIDGFPVSTAPGHKGRFIVGTLSGRPVICMQGRFHFYEGYDMKDIVLPVRLMHLLGVKNLIVTNAAGGINKDFNVGDLMLINDHINFMGTNVLIGKNDERFGVRFPDMSYAYNPDLRALAKKCAEAVGVEVKDGVYIGCTGPSYETPAEIRAFRVLGADAVGMSTVPEVIVAAHSGLKVLGISCITNFAAGFQEELNHEEVVEVTERVKGDFKGLLKAILAEL